MHGHLNVKFGKSVHLVGFIIRIYHGARSPERQIWESHVACAHEAYTSTYPKICLRVCQLSAHLIRLHTITFFSLQTNSGTHYTAPGTVTAPLDSLIGCQLRLLNQSVCTITGTRFGSYRCTKTGDKALRLPTSMMFEFFPTRSLSDYHTRTVYHISLLELGLSCTAHEHTDRPTDCSGTFNSGTPTKNVYTRLSYTCYTHTHARTYIHTLFLLL